MIELDFILQIEDGWPPVAKEYLVCTKCDLGFRIDAPPFFVKDLSVGDVIAVQENEEHEVIAWTHLKKSQHTTVWIMASRNESVEDVIDCLKKLNCNIERFTQYDYFSIDVPSECPVIRLDECLDLLDKCKTSVAFPSFRHVEM
jgi:hypothetical protein